MDFMPILNMLVEKVPVIGLVLMILGSLVVIGLGVVAITPSKDDDAFVAKLDGMPVIGALIKAIMAFSPIQKKPPQA